MVQSKYIFGLATAIVLADAVQPPHHEYTQEDKQLAQAFQPFIEDAKANQAAAKQGQEQFKNRYIDTNGNLNIEKVAVDGAQAIRTADNLLKTLRLARRAESENIEDVAAQALIDYLSDESHEENSIDKRENVPSQEDIVKGLKPLISSSWESRKIAPQYESLEAAALDQVFYLNRAYEGKYDEFYNKEYPTTDSSTQIAKDIAPLFRYAHETGTKMLSRYVDSNNNFDAKRAATDTARIYATAKRLTGGSGSGSGNLAKREVSQQQIVDALTPVYTKAYAVYSKINNQHVENGNFNYDHAIPKVGIAIDQFNKFVADVKDGKAQLP